MITRVLVPMDDSEMAEAALTYAFEAFPDAEITVLTVVGEPSPLFGQQTAIALADDPEAKAADCARPVFDRARELAAEHDAEVATRVEIGHPARVIVTRAGDFDTVVIGSHSGTVSERLMIGNVAETVFRRSPVPVTVVR
jgi:nucleotide-binding universal stress UspA family protein